MSQFPASRSPQARTLTLGGAITLNLLDMIGVGPFLTLPLLVGAMGGPQAMLGWILGAALALCDGLVWAELGAALPAAGGTYHFLRAIYPGRWGRWLSFLFLFQMMISAPLSIASGGIGLGQYAGVVFPRLLVAGTEHALHAGSVRLSWGVSAAALVGMVAILLAVWLLSRRLRAIQRAGRVLLVLVLGLVAWTVLTGILLGHWHAAFTMPVGAWRLDRGFWLGLGSAMLVATYDYWGYYNVAFLGGEARDPGRTIPRAILLSIAIVAVLYLLLNASVLSVLPSPVLLAEGNVEARRTMLAAMMRVAYAPVFGPHAAGLLAKLAAALVVATAFASVLSLLLGYSRVPFAAASEGGFFRVFGRLRGAAAVGSGVVNTDTASSGSANTDEGYPWVSLVVIGALACAACLLSLPEVIASLVVVRIALQFLLQHVGVLYLRRTRPGLWRPFRVWLYPLPPLVAIAGFVYIVVARAQAAGGLMLVGGIVVAGTLLWWVREASGGDAAA